MENMFAANLKKQPTQKRSKQRVDQIISAAQEIVINHGIEAITTTNVARQANVPVGSVYQYFESREDILKYLYATTYAQVLSQINEAIVTIPSYRPFADFVESAMTLFWSATKDHPSFRPLTRWANSVNPMWETVARPESGIHNLVRIVLNKRNIAIDPEREAAAVSTLATTLSILIDQAIEEDDEEKASILKKEIVIVLDAYVSTFTEHKSG